MDADRIKELREKVNVASERYWYEELNLEMELAECLDEIERLQKLLGIGEPKSAPDPYEYQTTTGGRKTWDGEPDLTEEGWEEYQPWERFDYHEERYWRRLIKPI